MNVVRTLPGLRQALGARPAGLAGLVPTMGAWHAGHVALLEAARRDCAHVMATIFVNPAQFGDPEDLAAYPRPEGADVGLARTAGVDLLFIPDVADVFPNGHATTVHVEGVALGYEGEHRDGHFDGVALICAKLFGMAQAQRAYFGQKDAQQVEVVRQLVRDLNVPIEIAVHPTVRDADGLALSSRNVRLSPDERRHALALPRALRAGLDAWRGGADPVPAARRALGGVLTEYVALVPFPSGPTLVAAIRVGTTRLIDNVPVSQPELAGILPGGPDAA